MWMYKTEESKFFSPNCGVDSPLTRMKTTVEATYLGGDSESGFYYMKCEGSIRDGAQAGGSCLKFRTGTVWAGEEIWE